MSAADRTRLERRLARARAIDDVETTYHNARVARPFDMTYGRRLQALGRLARELVDLGEDLRRAGGNPDAVHPTDADLEAAYRRLVGRRLKRDDVSDSVLASVVEVRWTLMGDYDLELPDLEVPDRVYPSGASRARR